STIVLSPPGALSQAVITFNGSVDPNTFDPAADLVLTGPAGNVIPGTTLTHGASLTVWTAGGAPQATPGVYQLVVRPDISDTAGFGMDLNRNGIFGERPQDQATALFDVNGLAVVSMTPSTTPVSNADGVAQVTLTFNQKVDHNSFSIGNVTLTDPQSNP